MTPLTDEQRNKLVEFSSDPLPLSQADIDTDFVYDRQYGFFVVAFGCHTIVMAHLFAFRNGFKSYIDLREDMDEIADKWLEQEGTCFQSSQASNPYVWKLSHLTIAEKRILGKNGFTEIG